MKTKKEIVNDIDEIQVEVDIIDDAVHVIINEAENITHALGSNNVTPDKKMVRRWVQLEWELKKQRNYFEIYCKRFDKLLPDVEAIPEDDFKETAKDLFKSYGNKLNVIKKLEHTMSEVEGNIKGWAKNTQSHTPHSTQKTKRNA